LADDILSERLSIIDPTDYKDLEALRQEILEIVEQRLDETETVPWSSKEHQFFFIRSKIIVFDTAHQIKHPQNLVEVIPKMSSSSIFYHLIDAKRRTPDNIDDISFWLRGYGDDYASLIEGLSGIDTYFLSLADLRQKLTEMISQHILGT